MSSNIRNTKYFDGLTASDIKEKIGCCSATAHRRIGLYRNGKLTYDEMIRPLGNKRKLTVESPDGQILDSRYISDVRGCNQNRACACMRQYKNGEITFEHLLSPVQKKHRYTHHRLTCDKARDYNLKKIPQPSKWEMENLL